MKLSLVLLVSLAVLALLGLRLSSAERRVAEAATTVAVLEIERELLELRAKAKSAALDSVRAAAAVSERVLAAQRAQASQRAAQAARQVSEAGGEVRVLLDSLGLNTEVLDLLVLAHDEEVDALEEQISLADSTAAVLRGQLEATDTALASERAVRLAALAENEALRKQVRALENARFRSRVFSGGIVVAVLVGAVLL